MKREAECDGKSLEQRKAEIDSRNKGKRGTGT
jgi:hypothetical protein